MFKTEKNYPYLHSDSIQIKEYALRPGDKIQLAVFSNSGYALVDVISPVGSAFSALDYVVKEDGFLQLPMLDSIYVSGLTVSEAEKQIQSGYAYYFVDPFVRLEITNKFVYVFSGRNAANQIALEREYMNLLEILAKAGGMPKDGKAYKVRILRGDLKNPQIILIDLSSIDGIKAANLTVQANDYIYIEPIFELEEIFAKFTPVFTIVSMVALVATIVKSF